MHVAEVNFGCYFSQTVFFHKEVIKYMKDEVLKDILL